VITVLAGGVGAARFLEGLVRVVDPAEITIIVNVGDDTDLYGVRVCPDSDIVTYTLAGLVNQERGFGLTGDTYSVVAGLKTLGVDAWFGLGDRDFATCLHRTNRLAAGESLHAITAGVATRLGVTCRLIPATDEAVRTKVQIDTGEWLDFQEYFVRRRNEPPVVALRYDAIESARPAPGVLEALATAEAILVAPSNPFLSIRPILGIPGIEDAVRQSAAPVVAVSPLVGGQAIKGPADRMMKSLGFDPSAAAIPGVYGGLLDGFVYDEVDAPLEAGIPSLATQTMMVDLPAKERLARATLEFARSLRR